MPADESRIGNPLAIVVNVRQLALWCPSKAGVVDPIDKAGHFQQHLSLGNERTRIRETEGRPKCVERDHPSCQASTVWRALAVAVAGGLTSLNTAKLSG